MGGASTRSISRIQERIADLQIEEKKWRKTWKHKKPCREWKWYIEYHGYGYCKHYARARHLHFKREIHSMLDLENDDGYLYKFVYISNKRI